MYYFLIRFKSGREEARTIGCLRSPRNFTFEEGQKVLALWRKGKGSPLRDGDVMYLDDVTVEDAPELPAAPVRAELVGGSSRRDDS